jgi:hypothetical protein
MLAPGLIGFAERALGSEAPAWPFELNRDSPQAQGLVGWWPLAEGAGPTARDLSDGPIGRNDGTLVGTPTRGNDGGTGLAGLDLTDNSTDGVRLTSSGSIFPAAPSELTWVARVRPTNLVGTQTIIEQKDGLLQVVLRSEGTSLVWYFRDLSLGWRSVSIGCLSTGTFYTACGRWSGGAIDIVLNGAVSSSQSASNRDTGINVGMHLGRNSSGGSWAGFAGDFRLYDRYLPTPVCRGMHDPETRWDLYWEPDRVLYFLPAAGGAATVTRAASLDGAVQAQKTMAASLDAGVQAQATAAAGADAAVRAMLAAQVSLGAAVRLARSRGASLDAVLGLLGLASASLGAAVAMIESVAAALDGAVRGPALLSAGLDGVVGTVFSASARRTVAGLGGRRHGIARGGRTVVVPRGGRRH